MEPATKSLTEHPRPVEGTVLRILLALSLSHMLNDTIQSLLPAIYPLLKESFHLTFAQVGLITFAFQLTASMLQPLVGFCTDRQPRPFSLAIGIPVVIEYFQTGLVPRLPTAVLVTGMMMLAFLSLFTGLMLDTVTRGRWEIKRLRYLALPGPQDLRKP